VTIYSDIEYSGSRVDEASGGKWASLLLEIPKVVVVYLHESPKIFINGISANFNSSTMKHKLILIASILFLTLGASRSVTASGFKLMDLLAVLLQA
jgi:hypothetical protein